MTGISESCEPNFSIRTFTGRARHFAYGETVRKAPLVATEKNLANPLFFFGMSLGHSLLSRVFNSKPLRNSGLFLLFTIV